MNRLALAAFALGLPVVGWATPPAASALSAGQIVTRDVAARGGAAAWAKVKTMVWTGRIETANGPTPSLHYVLDMKRPNKTRFEITVRGRTNIRLFDGLRGWTVRPSRSGTPQIRPFTAQETQFAREEPGIGGPLIGYPANGVAVTLEGTDRVGGRPAYRLAVRLPSGASHHVWIDAETFLRVKTDRQAEDPVGRVHTVDVYYRDYYSTTGGLQIPFVIETRAGPAMPPDRMVIEKVAINTPLDDGLFAGPITAVQLRSGRPGVPWAPVPAFGGVSGAGHGQ